jgi:hypothetical protein
MVAKIQKKVEIRKYSNLKVAFFDHYFTFSAQQKAKYTNFSQILIPLRNNL